MKHRRRSRRRRRRLALLSSILLFTGLGMATFAAAMSRFPIHAVPPAAADQVPPETGSVSQPEAADPAEAGSSQDTPSQDPSVLAPEGSGSSASGYDYGAPVPLSQAAGQDYFSDVLFVGNSITDGVSRYGVAPSATVAARNGLTVSKALTDPSVTQGQSRVSLEQYLKTHQFGKIYLMFGMNELGWPREEQFIRRYSELIDSLWQLQPNAVLYVQSIFPVTAERSAQDSTFNNQRIQRYNQLLQQLCAEKHALFLDTYSALADETGALPADVSPDGIHINKSAYQTWMDYILTHTWEGTNP